MYETAHEMLASQLVSYATRPFLPPDLLKIVEEATRDVERDPDAWERFWKRRVGLRLEPRADVTWVRFSHTGWPVQNEHYRVSCTCWAMYLRILRRSLEHGESVPYEDRLDV